MSAPRMPREQADRMRHTLLADDAWNTLARRRRNRAVVRVLVPAAAIAIAVAIGFVTQAVLSPRVTLHAAEHAPGAFEELARALHAGQAGGGSTASGDGIAAVKDWVRTHSDVTVSLASREGRPDAERFRLRGATVVTHAGTRAAVVSYSIDGRPVTLVTAPEKAVPGSPRWSMFGKQVMVRRLPDGAALLTWSNSGQAYALVSPLEGEGQRACLICHADGRREQIIAGLTLRP